MTLYTFDIIVEGLEPGCDDTTFDAVAAQLFEAGVEDGILGVRGGQPYVAFEREAESLLLAAGMAIFEVERAGTALRPVRVEADDLVTVAEIASRLELSAEAVRLHSHGRRRGGGFPAPRVTAPVKQWSWDEVAQWYGAAEDSGTGEALRVLNAYLTLSSHLRASTGIGRQHRLDAMLVTLLAEPASRGTGRREDHCAPSHELRVQKHGARPDGTVVGRARMRRAPADVLTPAERPSQSAGTGLIARPGLVRA